MKKTMKTGVVVFLLLFPAVLAYCVAPCWTTTPVATFTTALAGSGSVYYDAVRNEIITQEWASSNSIRRLNPQMTPLAVISAGYLQLSSKSQKSDGNYYLPVGFPSGNTIKVFNAQLTPVSTVNITTIDQPMVFDSADNAYVTIGTQIVKLNPQFTPVISMPGTSSSMAIDSSDRLYVGKINGPIIIYNSQLTPLATIAPTTTSWNNVNITSDGHVLQATRDQNGFIVYEPYPSLVQSLSWTRTETRGLATDSLSNLYMVSGGYLQKYEACAAATPTFTATPTLIATATVVCGVSGVDWHAATGNAAFGDRHLTGSVSFNGHMWSIAGASSVSPNYSDAWYSDDGVNWSAATRNAAFGPRCAHETLVYTNVSSGPNPGTEKMWVMGGESNGTLQNNVWWSEDGSSWYRSVSWTALARKYFSSVVFNNKMWMIGGNNASYGTPNAEVWSSADGVNWTMETGAAAFGARSYHSSCVFNDGTGDKIWLVGGTTAVLSAKNDIWKSSDGINWVLANAAPAFTGRAGHKQIVVNGEMWIVGGGDFATAFSDVWKSTDGVNWSALTTTAAFGKMGEFGIVNYNGSIWSVGGTFVTGSVNYDNQVWYTCAAPTATPTPIATSTMVCGVSGTDWTAATLNAAWPIRHISSSLTYNNKLWVIGGAGAVHNKDVWWSANGADWTIATGNAAFGPRVAHTSLVFTNTTGPNPGVEKMWLIGGEANGVTIPDVWWSVDGAVWTQATAAAAFGGRDYHTSVVFKGKMWVIAGCAAGDNPKFDTVYSSADGVTWTLEKTGAQFGQRAYHSSYVFDDGTGEAIYVEAGMTTFAAFTNDIWKSTDGINWTLVTAAANWGKRLGADTVVYNNEIWLTGGLNGVTYLNDVWKSSDGSTWTSVTSAAAFPGRGLHKMAAFDNRIWLMAGGGGGGNTNDVWYTCVGAATTPVPTATITATAITPSATQTAVWTATCTQTTTPVDTVTPIIPTFTYTPTEAVTVVGCNGTATPSYDIKVSYGGGDDTMLITITTSAPMLSAPNVTVYPHGNSDGENKIPMSFTSVYAAPKIYTVNYPKRTGYGDIAKIIVAGTDACGVSGTGLGEYTKVTEKEVKVIKNVFNSEKGERATIHCKGSAKGRYKITIYDRRGNYLCTVLDADVNDSRDFDAYWYGENEAKKKVASGIYYMVIEAPDYNSREKISVVK